MPLPLMLALTAAVLGAHLWLLRASPVRVQLREPTRGATFAIRRIEVGAAPAADLPRAQQRSAAGPPRAPAAPGRLHSAARPLSASRAAAAASRPEPAPAPAASAGARLQIPASMRVRYQVTASVRQQLTQGSSELLWRQDGVTYEASFDTSAPLLQPRRQHSTGALEAGGLAPQRFGDRGRAEQAAHFDREQRLVIFSNNRPSALLAAGVQDRVSVLLQLAALLAGEPARFPPGTRIELQTATTREALPWVFTVEGEETLLLPGGVMPAIKLVRPPQGQFDQRIEVWLAPGAAYVPVRLRLTQPNGDWVDHQWLATDRG